MSIGILGGTFDPVHNGHLAAARELRTRAGLEQVWLMPNAHPPHRDQPMASAEDRMRMVELAVEGQAGLVPSRLELERGGVSFTIDTLHELARRFPGQRFELLLGADAAEHIGEWHQAKAVLEEAWFVIFNRPGTVLTEAKMHELGFPAARTRTVQLATPDIASHEVRNRLQARAPIDDLVPPAVGAYIRSHHLYWT